MAESRSLTGNSSVQFRPGRSISGRYFIVRVLGRGGLGTVLLVRDSQLANQEIALKIPHRHVLVDERAGLRLRNELLLHRQLAHPGIVKIFHAGELAANVPFFTMEYVPGCSLRELLSIYTDRRMPAAEVKYVVRHVLESLAFAHSKGIVHRDIKPDNILISRDGSLKVSDFGLAQAAAEDHDFTRTGESVGTPSYMSPEQFATGIATERSDIYSLGVVVFEMLSGILPFTEATYLSLANAHLLKEPPWSALHHLDQSNYLIEFLARCLAKSPNDRFASAASAQQFLDTMDSTSTSDSEVDTRGSLVTAVRSRSRRTLKINSGMTIARLVFIAFCVIGYFMQIQGEDRKRLMYKAALQFRLAFGLESVPIEVVLGLKPIEDLGAHSTLRAAQRRDLDQLEILIHAGLPLNGRDPEGNTILHLAADSNYRGTIYKRASLVEPKWLDLRNHKGETGLLRAVHAGNLLLVRYLLTGKADPNIADSSGLTPLMAAVQRQDAKCVSLFLSLSRGHVQMHRFSTDGYSILSRAALNKDWATLKVLLRGGVDPNLRDRYGRTALMTLVATPRDVRGAEIAGMLVAAGADSAVLDHDGRSVKDWASAEWISELANLRSAGELEK